MLVLNYQAIARACPVSSFIVHSLNREWVKVKVVPFVCCHLTPNFLAVLILFEPRAEHLVNRQLPFVNKLL